MIGEPQREPIPCAARHTNPGTGVAVRHQRRLLLLCSAGAGLGLIALGGAGFAAWLLIMLDDGTPIAGLLTALAGFGIWSLLAAGFGLALWRAWNDAP